MDRAPRKTPRKIPTQKRSLAMVDAILEATARVLVEEGYDHATTNRIAEVAGVSVGSVYQYFPSKEALVLSLVRRHSAEMLALLERTASGLSSAPLPVALRSYVRAMLQAHAVEPELHRVLIHQVLHLDLAHVREVERRAQVIVQAYLEQHRDEIVPQRLDVAAFVLVTTVEAITHAAALDGGGLGIEPSALEDEICAVALGYLMKADTRAASSSRTNEKPLPASEPRKAETASRRIPKGTRSSG